MLSPMGTLLKVKTPRRVSALNRSPVSFETNNKETSSTSLRVLKSTKYPLINFDLNLMVEASVS
jgi:hypothetical protein